MVLTAQQQFRLRAKKALDTGDTTFKPRGKNKEIFDTMKQEHDKTMAQRQNSNLKRTKQQHTHEQDQKKRKSSSSSSSSSSPSASSGSEEEEAQVSSGEAGGAEGNKEWEDCEEKKPERVAKWKLSSENEKSWELSITNRQIVAFIDELSKSLNRMEHCTHDQAQISLAPIVKRSFRGLSVILVELPEEEAVPEGRQAADDRPKAEREEEKIIESNVDRVMHQIDAQNRARKLKLKMLAESADHSHPFQESFDKDAQQEAAKEGFVPGVPVFLNGNSKQKWHIDKIYCDRGYTCADISTTPHESGVVRHAHCQISQLTLAEPAPGPVIEEVPED